MKKIILVLLLVVFLPNIVQASNFTMGYMLGSSNHEEDTIVTTPTNADGVLVCSWPRADGCAEITMGCDSTEKKLPWKEWVESKVGYPVDIVSLALDNRRNDVIVYFKKAKGN